MRCTSYSSQYLAAYQVSALSPGYFLEGLVQRLGAKLVFVPMDEGRGFEWDLDRIEDAITERTKALFLNTPVNPTGRVLTLEELRRIGEIAETHDICVLADESYDSLTYDGRSHIYMLALPRCRERTVLVRSFTKSYVMPAWRVGYIVAEVGLTASFLKMFEWINLCANHVGQAAAAAAITGPQEWLAEAAMVLQANRDRILAGIGDQPFCSARPQGGPFLFLNVSGLGVDGDAFASLLFQRLGVPAISGAALQAPQHVRIPNPR